MEACSIRRSPIGINSFSDKGSKLSPFWFQGPEWLKEKELRPPYLIGKSSSESEAEAQPVKEIFKVFLQERDICDKILERNE